MTMLSSYFNIPRRKIDILDDSTDGFIIITYMLDIDFNKYAYDTVKQLIDPKIRGTEIDVFD